MESQTEKQDIKIAAIVILYNYDENVIENIITYSRYCDKIYAIDNSDAVNEDLKSNLLKIKKVEYIGLGKNEGIAKAINIGIERAIEDKYEWVLTMDQDSRFTQNIVDVYFKTLKNMNLKEIAVIAPNYFFDRKKNKKYKGYKELEYTMQSGNLINIDIYKKIGKYREDFFIDGVDYEYCLRARKNNYKIIECGQAILFHQPAITRKTFFGFKYGYCSPTRIYYQARNTLWISKNYNNIKMKLIVLYKLFKIIFLFDNKLEYLKMFNLGVKDFKKNKLGKLINV